MTVLAAGAGTAVPACRAARVAVCYDGNWYQHVARYLAHARGAEPSVAGLHDAIRWHAAGVFGCPVQRVTITHACYVAGRHPSMPATAWDQVLADHHILRRDMPVTALKGEVGADVELALTCYQIACETSPDLIALLAGDGDFAPLAARLAGRGIRVLVPRANVSYPSPAGTITVTTSAWLTRAATDTPDLTDLLDATRAPDYPRHLTRPCPARAAVRDGHHGNRRRGVITKWNPGSEYGFLTADDGPTWFASARDTPGQATLPPGTPVTFTGDPAAPAGKSYPRARAILPLPPAGTPPAPGPQPPARPGPGTAPSPAPGRLTAFDSAALASLRQAQGMSRGQLARDSGVSVATIKRLEREHDPACRTRTITLLAAALGQPPDTLHRGRPPGG